MIMQTAPLNKHTRLEAAVMIMKTVIKNSSKRLWFISRVIFLPLFKEVKYAL